MNLLDYLNVLQQSEEIPEEPVDLTNGDKEISAVTLYVQLQKLANIAETSTYDESLGEEPGPSPDDTDLLTESQQSDPTQYANIVKFYEEIDSTTLQRNNDNSFTFARKILPQIIEIEDETDTTGYTLIEWFTSERYIAPTDGKYYEDYKDKLSIFNTGTYTGAGIDIIKFIDEEGNHTGETTLYILLQKEVTPDKPKLPVTSTYDEDLGNQPGPAPDDSNLLTDDTTDESEE